MSPDSTPQRPTPATTILIDAGLVVVFCLIGRLSHAEGILGDIPGLVGTIWPFLAALVVAHAAALVFRMPAERVVPGILIWLVTLGGGMALRALSGQGTAWAFVIVAAVTLAVLLIGWRLINVLVQRRRRTR